MSNAKSMTTGGASSAIGPVQMRKVVPFSGSSKDVILAEKDICKDNSFSSAREQLANMSFSLDSTRISPMLSSRVQVVREQLIRAATFKKP